MLRQCPPLPRPRSLQKCKNMREEVTCSWQYQVFKDWGKSQFDPRMRNSGGRDPYRQTDDNATSSPPSPLFHPLTFTEQRHGLHPDRFQCRGVHRQPWVKLRGICSRHSPGSARAGCDLSSTAQHTGGAGALVNARMKSIDEGKQVDALKTRVGREGPCRAAQAQEVMPLCRAAPARWLDASTLSFCKGSPAATASSH